MSILYLMHVTTQRLFVVFNCHLEADIHNRPLGAFFTMYDRHQRLAPNLDFVKVLC